MPMHAQVKAVIARREASVSAHDPDEPLDVTRQRFMSTWREPGPEVASITDHVAPGPDGPVPVRLYLPDGDGPFPLLVGIHGGGFVFGGIDAYDGNARRLAVGADCAVLNVEYRLAPENRFPAAPEDCYAAVLWAAEQSALGLDGRIALGGDSAGANLSTVVSMMSRDRGGPEISAQIMMCPALHPDFLPAIHDPDETPPMLKWWWWEQYLADPEDAENPYAVPLADSADLTGLPSALVITAEFDELLGEGAEYARRLEAAGVPVTYRQFDGMWHIFHMYPEHIDAAREAVAMEVAALREAFAE